MFEKSATICNASDSDATFRIGEHARTASLVRACAKRRIRMAPLASDTIARARPRT
ncbi:hypothetical protein DB32_007840 [Sandaracinus amylolyticus]|uniref:Uncharacterized protein n=1 Tax=Sandaracinus amylolyticus TaxID=927083 RepID=A0A0F6YNT1_9BACT|nr:hypothetical protein DB32_007840 [Sandaracinus amylolyticus]